METQPPDRSAYGPPPETSTWSQKWRLQFIDFRLRWEGRLNRKDLEDFFGISPQQATNDFQAYLEAAADNLKYEPKLRAYVATPWFHPVYERSASRFYLNELLSLRNGLLEPAASFLGWQPNVVTVPTPGRPVEGNSLMQLLHALRGGRMVSVRYQTMGRDTPTQRVLSPHGLAHDGWQWHVRAFCHLRKEFRDFSLARLHEVHIGTNTTVDFAEDMEWHTELTVTVAAHPSLTAGSRAALELDYGMQDGRLDLTCRHSMLYYTLRSLGVLQERGDAGMQQLVLLNREELAPYLATLGHKLE
jgi:hypothetical protein